MMGTSKEAKLHDRFADWPGVHSIRRPVTPGSDDEFDLSYIRAGPPSDRPLLVVPGGPGLASVMPYRALRKDAAARGLDIIMMEHRGIGLSRRDDTGADLPWDALTIDQVVDDMAAVLDDCGVSHAVVYGSSYGGYLTQGFGVRHPGRVAGMVLDSTGLTADDNLTVRENTRQLLWHGTYPETDAVAQMLRNLVADRTVAARETGTVVPVVYEFGGTAMLDELYRELAAGRGRRTWQWIYGLAEGETDKRQPFMLEPDPVGVLTFRELERRPEPDGLPLDPGLLFTDMADDYPPFQGEPYDLPAELPRFDWPSAVISGERDLRAPRVISERIANLLPDGVLVPLAGMGHSALDTHRLAGLHVAHAVMCGTHDRLPQLADRIATLPRRGASGMLGPLIAARLTMERLIRR